MAITIQLARVLAKQGIAFLAKDSGLCNLVNRDYQTELGSKGKTIDIIKPPTFTVNEFNPNDSTKNKIVLQDYTEDVVTATLDQWWDTSFPIPDFERTVSERDLLNTYLIPAMQPLVDKMESTGYSKLIQGIGDPQSVQGSGSTTLTPTQIVNGRAQLKHQLCPVTDVNNMFGIVNEFDEASLLTATTFTSSDYGAPSDAIKNAVLDRKYGFNLMGSVNVPRIISSSMTGAINNAGGYAAGAGSSNLNPLAVNGFTVAPPPGAIITIGSDGRLYTVAPGSTATALIVVGGLVATVANGATITIIDCYQNPFFHRNAITLAMRPLELPPAGTGTVSHVENYKGYSIRVQLGYSLESKRVVCSMDALWTWAMLDPRLAVKELSRYPLAS